MILAIDTATDMASVAVAHRTQVLAECSWAPRGNHSRTLPGVLQHMVSLAGAGPIDIDAVVVASGPGSFNGVRVGISAAKGIAMAREAPLAGISTLDVTGFAASNWPGLIWSILPAGRGEVYVAEYHGGEDWRRTGPYRRLSASEVAEEYEAGTLLTGDGAESMRRLVARNGRQANVQTPGMSVRRAGYLTELGCRYFEAGGTDQVDDLEPLYLRLSSAEERRGSEET